MERTTVERDTSMCFACGREPGPEAVCQFCFTDTGMEPPETITDSTVSVGYEGGGRRAVVAIGVTEAPSSAMVFTVTGGVRRVHVRHLKLFSPLSGLRSMTSRAGAALVALEHLPIPAVTDVGAARKAVIATFVGDRVPVARRVAADLAAAGCVGPIDELPLSVSERNWWSALGHIRIQQFDSAVERLTALPPDAYPDAVGLLVWCTSAPIEAVRQRARVAVERRLALAGEGSALAAAASATGHVTAAISWLIDPQPPVAIVDLRTDVPSPAFELLRALQGGGDRMIPLRLPPSASLPIMDDLVDLQFRIDEQSLNAVTADEARYLVARSHPELLTDEDIDSLDFVSERDRRTMLTGRIPDPTADHPDSPMMAAIRALVVEHRSDPLLRDEVGPVADALAALLANPSAETLVDGITDDDSTWGLLEKRLDDDALRWNPPKGGSARRFLGWLALRRTQQSIYAGDWHQAVKHGRHALRLAESEAATGEALNMQAFAEWQLHRDDAAKTALETALEGRRQRSLQANLSIVAPEAAADPGRSSF